MTVVYNRYQGRHVAARKGSSVGADRVVIEMAKKKPGPKLTEGVGRTAQTMIRSTAEWKAWLERLADFNRSNVSDTVDRGVVELARSLGFKEAPPRR